MEETKPQPADYTGDLARIRAIMERSARFHPLSGWSGMLVGTYALAGALLADRVLGFHPQSLTGSGETPGLLAAAASLALLVLGLSVVTVAGLSRRKAAAKGEPLWGPAARLFVAYTAAPLAVGGAFMAVLLYHGLIGLLAPASLIFYGLAMYSAARHTYPEAGVLGAVQILLGLAAAWFIPYAMLLWSVGFGVVHIAFGLYMHRTYER